MAEAVVAPPPLPGGLRARQSATNFDDPQIDDFDEDRSRRSKRPTKKSVLPWVVGGVGAVVLFAGSIVVGYWLFSSGAGELDLVPGDAEFFIHLRLGDMLRNELGKKALDDIKALQGEALAEITKHTGLELTDIDRVTVAGTDMRNGMAWGIVNFTKAPDRQKLYSHPALTRKDGEHEGKKYDVLVFGKEPMAVYWPTNSMAVVGKEEAVKKCLTMMAAKRPSGPMDEVIARAREKHSLVLGIVPPADAAKNSQAGGAPSLLDPGEVLRELKSGMVVLDSDTITKVEVGARMGSDNAAQTIKGAIELGLGAAKQNLDFLKTLLREQGARATPPMPKATVDTICNTVKEALDSVQVDQSGAVLTVRAAINMKALDEAFAPYMKEAMSKLQGIAPLGGR
jgi:hypothetical protein